MTDNPLRRAANQSEHTVFSVGHSTLPIERFITLLKTYGIDLVVDIRTIPRSRHNPQFAAVALANSLKTARILYTHEPALGGLRRALKDSPNAGWHNMSFRGFADYMQTKAFLEAIESLIQMSLQHRTAIMCAEAVPWRCHRMLVADALNMLSIPVIEILSERTCRLHKVTPFAKMIGGRITYPSS